MPLRSIFKRFPMQRHEGKLRGAGIFLIAGLVLIASSFLLPSLLQSLGSKYQVRIQTGSLSQLVGLFGSLLLLQGLSLLLQWKLNGKRIERHLFPITIAVLSTALLIGYRHLTGAGFGFEASQNRHMLATGILHNPIDNFSYVAWAEQAKRGACTFSNLYTTENHSAVYFNTFFLILGNLSRWLHVPVLPLLIPFGILGSAIVVLTSYYASVCVGLPEGAGKGTAVFLAFGSGVSIPAFLLGRLGR